MRLRRFQDARSTARESSVAAWLVSGLAAAFAFASPASAAEPQNLYDWMATAPLVVAGRVVADDLRYVEVEALGVARGDASPGTRFAVDLRTANRDRKPNTDALRLERGSAYVFLLTPAAKSKSASPARFDLVRGIDGARPIPQEGIDAYVGALARFAEIQAKRDDDQVWKALRGLLEDPDPLILQTTLDLFLKYRRGAAADSARVRPLLDHPRDQVRELAARFLGELLALPGAGDPVERAAVFGELAARARRDESVPVRVAATESAAATRAPGVDELLREIARQDPDQTVRYVAERALYERRTDGESPVKPN